MLYIYIILYVCYILQEQGLIYSLAFQLIHENTITNGLFFSKQRHIRENPLFPQKTWSVVLSSAVEYWTKEQTESVQTLPQTLYFTLQSRYWHYSRQHICIPLLFDCHPANYGIINRTFLLSCQRCHCRKCVFTMGILSFAKAQSSYCKTNTSG